MSKDQETLFAIRIEKRRASFLKQLMFLVVIMLGLGFVISLFAAGQYYYCIKNTPDAGVRECLFKDFSYKNFN